MLGSDVPDVISECVRACVCVWGGELVGHTHAYNYMQTHTQTGLHAYAHTVQSIHAVTHSANSKGTHSHAHVKALTHNTQTHTRSNFKGVSQTHTHDRICLCCHRCWSFQNLHLVLALLLSLSLRETGRKRERGREQSDRAMRNN